MYIMNAYLLLGKLSLKICFYSQQNTTEMILLNYNIFSAVCRDYKFFVYKIQQLNFIIISHLN